MKAAALAILIIFLSLPVFAQTPSSVSTRFIISEDNSVAQHTEFTFADYITGKTLNYSVADDVRGIQVSDGTEQLQYNFANSNIEIFLQKPTNKLVMDYTTNDVVFQSGSVRQFFTSFSFDSPVTMNVDVILPAGYSIYQDSYYPGNAIIGSYNNQVKISWFMANVTDSVISIKFSGSQDNLAVFALIAIIAALAVALHHYRKKSKAAFLEGFMEDEKRTIRYIEERKIILQSDLEKEFKFSRAKATRIVSKLVEKNIITKKRYGRTNRLSWTKGSKIKLARDTNSR